jgi:hypothetical protein
MEYAAILDRLIDDRLSIASSAISSSFEESKVTREVATVQNCSLSKICQGFLIWWIYFVCPTNPRQKLEDGRTGDRWDWPRFSRLGNKGEARLRESSRGFLRSAYLRGSEQPHGERATAHELNLSCCRGSQTCHALQVFRIPITLHRDFRGRDIDFAKVICRKLDCD